MIKPLDFCLIFNILYNVDLYLTPTDIFVATYLYEKLLDRKRPFSKFGIRQNDRYYVLARRKILENQMGEMVRKKLDKKMI